MEDKEIRGQIDKLHSDYGIRDIKDLPLSIPGKGHWLWGLYTRIYVDRGMNECSKRGIHPNNTVVEEA
jgi:hypothetical protein